MENYKHLLIISDSHILTHSIVKVFKTNSSGWKILMINTVEDKDCDKFILFENNFSETTITSIYKEVETFSKKYDAIIHLSGTWDKSSLKSIDIFSQSDIMFKKNYFYTLLAAHLASKYLNENSLIIFTGAAKVFKESIPDMLAYQVAKTASHSLAQILKDSSELPNKTTIITILPEIIDTDDNRILMPLEDTSKWVSPEGVAALIKMWADGYNRPKSGAFAVLKNKDNCVMPEFV